VDNDGLLLLLILIFIHTITKINEKQLYQVDVYP